jgi:replicative DNA helicase
MFQTLFTTSIARRDLSFLKRLPPKLIAEDQRDAVEWVLSYEQAHGVPPLPSRVQKSPHGRWCRKVYLSQDPLSDIYESTVHVLKEFVIHQLTDELANADESERNRLIQEIVAVQSISPYNKAVSIRSFDRSSIYRRPSLGVAVAKFGLSTIDALTMGLLPGEIAFVGGRPGDGKTMLLCHMAVSMMTQGHRVFFNSKEMPNMAIISRIDGILGGFDTSKVRRLQSGDPNIPADEIDKLAASMVDSVTARLSSIPEGDIIFPDSPRTTPRALFDAAMNERATVIIADGVYLMEADDAAAKMMARDWRAQAAITSSIKSLALATGIPFVGSTQLKRGSGGDGGVGLDSLAFSDSFGQDSDIVIVMTKLGNRRVSLTLAKNRNGVDSIGQVIEFNFENGTLKEGGSLDE